MKRAQMVSVLVVVLAIGAVVGYVAGSDSGKHLGTTAPDMQAGERKILYWYDPMVPDQRFDKPGKSPFMDMDLVPKYADEGEAGKGVTIDARVAQNIGVRTAPVTRGTLAPSLTTVAYVKPDERRIAVVQARVAGWVEVLRVRAVNDPVKKGMPLAAIYAPDLLAAQEEYLLLRVGDRALREAAKQNTSIPHSPTRAAPCRCACVSETAAARCARACMQPLDCARVRRAKRCSSRTKR